MKDNCDDEYTTLVGNRGFLNWILKKVLYQLLLAAACRTTVSEILF